MLLWVALALAASTFQPSVSPAGATLSGRVLEEGSGIPVAGAMVTLSPFEVDKATLRDRVRSVVSDEDGRYDIREIAEGHYRIMAGRDGFALMRGSQAVDVSLRPREVRDRVDILLQKEAVIVGQVLNPAGQPVASGRVLALRRGVPSPDSSTEYDRMIAAGVGANIGDGGAFRLTGLPPDEYYVRVVPRVSLVERGGVTVSTYFPGTVHLSEAQPIVVGAGEKSDEIVIRLVAAPGFQVFGSVADRERRPVAHASVTLAVEQPTEARTGATIPLADTRADEFGRFTFTGVPAGKYVLLVRIASGPSQRSMPLDQSRDVAPGSSSDSSDIAERFDLTVELTNSNIRLYLRAPPP
jgi:hypothetical protein